MKNLFLQITIIGLLFSMQSCQQTLAENKKDNALDIKTALNNGKIEILKNYKLPKELNEISGMVWLSKNTFACVQDEEGIIYIYNTERNEILNRIQFSGKGDFEALAVNETTAYVQRSDGVIFIVENFQSKNPEVKEFKTFLNAKQNIEGIAYDKKNNRLLSSVKDMEPGDKDYKGLYAFDLESFTMDENPVFKIPVKSDKYLKAGLKKASFYTSGISFYEATGHLFIVDGRQAGLMEMDEGGNILKIYSLGIKDFSQAESITFDKEGNIFVSSEAGKEKAHISQIKLPD